MSQMAGVAVREYATVVPAAAGTIDSYVVYERMGTAEVGRQACHGALLSHCSPTNQPTLPPSLSFFSHLSWCAG